MTKLKMILAAAALVAAPGLASAQCSWGKSEQVTMSCAPGTTWDATAGVCVPEATG
ncbi:adenylosuccinate lyase [Jannaschia seohaensis]|uniref:Chitin binding Peritrophin-A domain-containing protein n=1 Tax=Jannaschia seohaensis TaxID=475081 RepID=A0A2Y9AC04_9RHOB|nr:adenylosuccinate lyase [Jannaschia seohaensis]PWJ21066.1 hypothetical protein BCF38_102314 [Jannaschia seohaensis]SSA41476.1 hypothetical protein SAMN05421539_102314 [Jannaschia seohaensis]